MNKKQNVACSAALGLVPAERLLATRIRHLQTVAHEVDDH